MFSTTDIQPLDSSHNEILFAAHQFCLAKKRRDLEPKGLSLPYEYEYERGANPFVMIKYNTEHGSIDDDGIHNVFFEMGKKGENKTNCPTYYALFDEEAFRKTVDRKANASNHSYVYPLSSVFKCSYKELEVMMTHLIRPDDGSFINSKSAKGSIMDERFYEYLLNLNTLPVLTPVSPVVLLLVRPSYRKPYDVSSLSFCILKTLFHAAMNNDRVDRADHFTQKVKENLLSNIAKVVNNYEECLSGACCYYAYSLEKQAASMCFLPDLWKGMREYKREKSVKEYEQKVELALKDFVKKFEETIHRFWIDLINVYECGCINLYLYDHKADKEKEYANFCDWETVCGKNSNSFWSTLLTKNIFKPFPKFTWEVAPMSPRSRSASKTNAFKFGVCGEPKIQEEHEVTSKQVLMHHLACKENQYMIGREVKSDKEKVISTQVSYLDSYASEYGKLDFFHFDVAKEFDGRFPTLFLKEEINDEASPFCISAQTMVRFMDIQLNSMMNDFDRELRDKVEKLSIRPNNEKETYCDDSHDEDLTL